MVDLERASVMSADGFAAVDDRLEALPVAGGKRMRSLGLYLWIHKWSVRWDGADVVGCEDC